MWYFVVSVRLQSLLEEFIGQDTGLQEAVDSLPYFDVDEPILLVSI